MLQSFCLFLFVFYQEIMKKLKTVISEDLVFYKKRLNCKSSFRIFLITRSFHLLFLHRVCNYIWRKKYFRFCRSFFRFLSECYTCCEIHPEAAIGSRIFFPHPIGIVIGQGVKIGNDAIIFQHVTLGGRRDKNGDLAYPVLHHKVVVYCHSCILGNLEIRSNSIVGACSLVLSSFPENSVIFGSPAKLKP